MPPTRYERVTSFDKHDATYTSPSSSSEPRLTPDSSADLDLGRDELGEDGYELQQIEQDGRRVYPRDEGDVSLGAEEDGDEDEAEPLAGGRRRRRSSAQSFELYTPDEERKVRRKLDRNLVLFVALLYMMSFLDRSNIGNAKTAGMSRDLSLSDDLFEWLLTGFYITYVLFEWTTLCYKIFPPHIYISCCVCAWGLIASTQSLATGFGFLLFLRILLGVAEAAFVGMPIYLSFFFRREELAFRTGIFIAAAPLATSFASTLAYVIVRFGDLTRIANWRLLFLVEGFPACLVAVWAYYWIPDSPATARWLNDRERKIATLRKRNETALNNSSSGKPKQTTIPRHKQKFQWDQVKQTLTDPKSYLTAGMFFCCNVAFSSMPVFLPSILTSFGNSELASQGLSAFPNLFAFVIVLITAFVSDKLQSRSGPMVFHALLALSGFLFLAIDGFLHMGSAWSRYFAIFPICAGFFSCVTTVITWTVNNQVSDEGKGTGMAVLNVIGQMGPILGTRLYPDEDGPWYVKGMTVCAVCMGLVAVLAWVLRWYLRRENGRLRRSWSAVGEMEGPGKGFVYMT